MTHEAYKRFIDELVTHSQRSVAAARVRAHGHPVRTNEVDLPLSDEEQRLKAIFLRLTDAEREVLAQAFVQERQGALHDFASFLEWATSTDEMSIKWGTETFGSSPFTTMHGDFIARVGGGDWESA